MNKPADPQSKGRDRGTGKWEPRPHVSIVPVIHVLSAEEMRALLARCSGRGEPDPRARALQRDASGMRPGDVLVEHMRGLEQE